MNKYIKWWRWILGLFGWDRSPILSLELGASAVKVLVLGANTDRQLCLLDCVIEPLAVAHSTAPQRRELIQALQRALAKLTIRSHKLCLALPPAQVVTRTMQCATGLNDREMGAEIALVADHYIPYPFHEIKLDYKNIGANAQDPELVDVMLVAAKHEDFAVLEEIAEAADLELSVVEPQTHALARMARRFLDHMSVQHKICALFDLGRSEIIFIVLHETQILYTHSEDCGTQSIGAANIGQKLSTLLQNFYATGARHVLELGLLSGEQAMDLNLSDLTEQLKLQLYRVDPFVGMHFAETVDQDALQRTSAGWAQCCGLALRTIDHHGY